MTTAVLSTTPDAPVLTRRELASYLRRSVVTLDRDNAAGRLPRPIRLGAGRGSIRWLRSEIDAWLSAGAPPREQWERIRRAAR